LKEPQVSLKHLVHREQLQSLQMLKFLPLKTLNFQIRRAKARWQAQKPQTPHWCASHKLATHVRPLPTLLQLQNLLPQLPTPKQNQRVATVAAASVAVVIVARHPTAAVTIR
jgi:hypothetical protein